MNLTHRDYVDQDGDFLLISRFIYTHYAQVRRNSTWCIGRFVDWRYGMWGKKPTTPDFWDKNAHLWFDGFGRLAGFAISEEGGCEFAVITTEGYGFLFEELLDWCTENWGDRGPELSLEITSHQRKAAECLERHGFAREATFIASHFDLATVSREPLPLEDGFRIVAMRTPEDYRNQLILRNDAFRGIQNMPEDELEELQRVRSFTLANPIYHADTDLCVVAPDGSFVSGCEALIDTHNLEVDIERVCTHSGYRRRGFGKAVIQECMVRLQAMGFKKAHIVGYSEEAIGLYSSLMPFDQTEYYIYQQQTR
jgi:ribosomal protein S18 acetylase RimI-like enzyme